MFYLLEKFCLYFRITHTPESSCFKKFSGLEAWCSLALPCFLCFFPLPTFQSIIFLSVEDEGISSSVPVCFYNVVLGYCFWVEREKSTKEYSFIIALDSEHPWHEWRAVEAIQTRQHTDGMTLSYIINPLITSSDGQQCALRGEREEQMSTLGLVGALWAACHWEVNPGKAAALECDQVEWVGDVLADSEVTYLGRKKRAEHSWAQS